MTEKTARGGKNPPRYELPILPELTPSQSPGKALDCGVRDHLALAVSG